MTICKTEVGNGGNTKEWVAKFSLQELKSLVQGFKPHTIEISLLWGVLYIVEYLATSLLLPTRSSNTLPPSSKCDHQK